MRKCWAFAIAADESSDAGLDSHLDVRIQFPPIAGVEHSSFHLLAIPMFDRSHTGKDYADCVIKVLDALYSEWRTKLIGVSTDGAGNMTGHNIGFSALLRNESKCKDAFYRVWCIAHQLDLVVKESINRLDDSSVFPFIKPLTDLVAYLRRQQTLINEMGSKCPYYITVRWKSLSGVCKWLVHRQARIRAYVLARGAACSPSASWFVFVYHCLFAYLKYDHSGGWS
jgi:hypothetical protein